ncbi:hypothetical protein GCM10011445_10830 [Pseudocitrobacter faecalis]|nr:hypothetical protein GCM10011445_10830 [Pseudocitrobacter faecalis]
MKHKKARTKRAEKKKGALWICLTHKEWRGSLPAVALTRIGTL